MGITELIASLAPRRKMKRSFFPLRPILPSASARFITNGMSTKVDNATPRPNLNERSKKARRVKILKLRILLLLESLKAHQRADHAADTLVIIRRGRRVHLRIGERRRVGCRIGAAVVQRTDGRAAIEGEVSRAFARIKDAQKIIGQGRRIRPTGSRQLGFYQPG